VAAFKLQVTSCHTVFQSPPLLSQSMDDILPALAFAIVLAIAALCLVGAVAHSVGQILDRFPF